MKAAIIGSRNLIIDDLSSYLPVEVTEIISGGARGIDACAKKYASVSGIKFVEFLPEYDKYGKNAPLIRNLQIIDYADCVIAFWDGKSRGTKFVIENCKKKNKKVIVHIMNSLSY
ncbi:MAG: DUF2493 domain-containing protein [Ruminococcaceae bacterium]|nr:DUF2493 domain-containing protein [Oscillospiraceae bacterium]